jgi:hypothetical protein
VFEGRQGPDKARQDEDKTRKGTSRDETGQDKMTR